MAGEFFENVNQVHTYLKAQGWKVAYNTLRKAIDERKLVERRKGGFAQRTVDQFARVHLAKKADPTPEPELPAEEKITPGLHEQKLQRQISGMEMKERREHFAFMRERGLYTQTVTVERELADRWLSIKLFLSSWLVAEADTILAMLGGDPEQALRVLELVHGDKVHADALSQHMFSRKAELVDLFRKGLTEALSKFGSGQWFTEEMREAWEEFELNREDASREAAEDVLELLGADIDPEAVEAILAQYWVLPKEAA